MVDVASTPGAHTSRISAPGYTREGDHQVRAPYSKDRVRSGPIVAGLFGTLSILALLSVLGLAVGLSTVDRNSDAGNYGIGAGIWGAISALVAFAFGGWLAARTSAVVGGGSNAVLQGAMVWMVTIGLLMYLVAGGLGTLFRATSDVATRTASSVAADRVNNANTTGATNTAGTGTYTTGTGTAASDPVAQATNGANRVADNLRTSVSGDDVERVAGNSAAAAWGTLVSMLLGLIAAAGGGFLGSRFTDVDDDDRTATDYSNTGKVSAVR
jgi:hypothetical protein